MTDLNLITVLKEKSNAADVRSNDNLILLCIAFLRSGLFNAHLSQTYSLLTDHAGWRAYLGLFNLRFCGCLDFSTPTQLRHIDF